MDAAAEREATAQRAALCSRAAREFFNELLPATAQAQVGRPTNELKTKREQREVLKAAYIAAWAQAEATPQAWFESEACRELCRSRGWEKLHADPGAAVGGAEAAQVGGGAVEEEEEGAAAAQTAGTAAAKLPAAPRKYDKASAALMSLYNVWGHKWAQDGSHCGWNTAVQLKNKVWEVLHHVLPLSTASRHLAAEKKHYENKGGVRSQPDLAELIKAATATRRKWTCWWRRWS